MILHITNDFSGSTVYKNFFTELDDNGVEQIVYNPIRDKSRIGRNFIVFKQKSSRLIYSVILNKHIDRLFLRFKIKKIIKDIEKKIDLSQVKFIHAHTWYSDGGVAYYLAKKYNIPYVITIRNSDLNIFYKYLYHERTFGRRILSEAKAITLISAAYTNRLLALSSLKSIKTAIVEKLSIIPNGVDNYWITNKSTARTTTLNNNLIRLLYIGKFNRGKNVANLILAVKKLNLSENNIQYQLTLVGGGGNDEKGVCAQINMNSFVNYLGPIYEKTKLREIFKSSDIFTMPSKRETFGLVYVEALLSGLPVLYTKNEGIDGYYDNSIGEKVENYTISEIANKIKIMTVNLASYQYNIKRIANNHNWKTIAKKYLRIYNS